MAKKQKEEVPNVNATANRDVVQRLNFLYQASVYLQSIAQPPSSYPTPISQKVEEKGRDFPDAMGVDGSGITSGPAKTSSKRKTRRRISAKQTTSDLARSYVQCMRIVGQKTTVKIDPSLKRSLCSNCNTTLVPGSSATIRVKNSPSHGHIMIYTCCHCKATKRIPAPQSAPALFMSPSSSHVNPLDFVDQTTPKVSSDLSSVNPGESKSKKDNCPSHPLPLFARPDAGHVVFRGNDQLPLDASSGFGVFFA